MQLPQRKPCKFLIRFSNMSSEAPILSNSLGHNQLRKIFLQGLCTSPPFQEYSPDTPGIRPIPCHPGCQQKRRNWLVKQEVIINQLLLLCISHVPQSIVLPLEITLQATQSWKRVTFRMGPKMLDIPSTSETTHKVWQCLICWVWFLPCSITELKAVSDDSSAPSRLIQVAFVPLYAV